jgi:hypothetical protein
MLDMWKKAFQRLGFNKIKSVFFSNNTILLSLLLLSGFNNTNTTLLCNSNMIFTTTFDGHGINFVNRIFTPKYNTNIRRKKFSNIGRKQNITIVAHTSLHRSAVEPPARFIFIYFLFSHTTRFFLFNFSF